MLEGPNFIGIGVPKAGTTWLDSMLRLHPQIWLPPIKELHFFDDFYRQSSNRGLDRYFSKNSWVKNRWRRNFKAVTKNAIRFPTWSRINWALRFLLMPMSFSWYSRLFEGQNLLKGEITPDYCTLTLCQAKEIARNFPHLKVLLMLRNPIERAWSHCRMELLSRQGRELFQVSEFEIEEFLFSDHGVLARSDYSKILQIWWEVFDKNSVFVGLLDEVTTNPIELINRVFSFLEVGEVVGIETPARKVVHKGKKEKLPAPLYKRLREYYVPEITKLDGLLPEKKILEKWLVFNE